MNRKLALRIGIYASGMVLLALGLVLNTKTGLGTSPLVSIAYCISCLSALSFSDAAFLMYCLFAAIEIVLHLIRRHFSAAARDLLQLPFSLVFTRFMGLFDRCIPDLALECAGTVWGEIWMRLLILAAAILLIGSGASMMVNMRLIPNPGDGCVLGISDFSGAKIGTVKNIFDIVNVSIACLIGLAFRGKLLGTGIGTVLAMLGVGRVMGLVSGLCEDFFSQFVPREGPAPGRKP